jgi:RND superfamily putative drug exporter
VHTIATWCFRHRRIVLAAWLLGLVALFGLSSAAGSAYSNSFTLPHTDSTRAIDLLKAASPRQSGDTEQIVVAAKGGATIEDPAVQSQVNAMLARVSTLPHVTTVVSPYSPAGASQVSANRTIAFATVTFDELGQSVSTDEATTLVKVAKSADSSNLQVAVSGQVAEKANRPGLGGSGIGIIAAAVVLFLVFGSLLAMALPLISTLVSLGTAISLIGLLSHVLKMPEFSSQLVLLIGLGVGVDYALFIVTRHRQGLLAGRDVESSLTTALRTSGRAVLFAGIIVCIALLGMFALGISFLNGLAVAASIGVLFTMAASLTLLPALLGFMGPRVLSRRQRAALAATGRVDDGGRSRWARWSARLERAPLVPAVAAVAVIVVLALPFFSLRLGASDQGNDPTTTTTRQAYDLLATGFGPGFNGPLQLTTVVHDPSQAAALQRVVTAVGNQPGVARVGTPRLVPAPGDGQVALVTAYPRSAPQDAATADLIQHLRSQVIPPAVAGSHLVVYVGGNTAIFSDFSHVLGSKLPVFVGVIVGLSFLLLVVVFRSLVIPITAAIMNLLSAGAAFGIITAVFEWGWLGSVFGVSRAGPVEAFLPVMLFSILFGLSTDYEVFLVTRIHEEWLRTGDNGAAVRRGLAATGRTITAAAAIMVLVFGSFILGGERVIKEFGLGLAAAILVDAVVIRSVAIPGIMLLIGRANWWFPSWLDRRLPRISMEPEIEPDDEVEPKLVGVGAARG